MLALVAIATGVAGCDEGSGEDVKAVASGDGFDEPTALAFRPGSEGELWVTNHGDDSIAIVADAGGDATVANRRDAYAEHFVARPAGLSFDSTGEYLVANDSNNEVRDIHFEINPELYFTDVAGDGVGSVDAG